MAIKRVVVRQAQQGVRFLQRQGQSGLADLAGTDQSDGSLVGEGFSDDWEGAANNHPYISSIMKMINNVGLLPPYIPKRRRFLQNGWINISDKPI